MEFSDTALNKLLQVAPEIGNLIVTFKDMSAELPEDYGMGIGAFILHAGDDYAFVPVISKSTTVMPIDSIFLNSEKKFLPLTNKTVEFLLNLQKSQLGKSVKMPKTVNANPSVQDLVNPPRTGKYVYASAGRLVEFLSTIPSSLKHYLSSALVEDTELARPLHKMFGLQNIMTSLQTRVEEPVIVHEPARVITGGEGLAAGIVNEILTKGYSIIGNPPVTRIAVAEQTAEKLTFTTLAKSDEFRVFEFIMKDGTRKDGLVIPMQANALRDNRVFVLFAGNEYAIGENFVVSQSYMPPKDFLRILLGSNPPVMLKDIHGCETTFAIMDNNFKCRGIFTYINSVMNQDGVRVNAYTMNREKVVINGLRSLKNYPEKIGNELFVPFNSFVTVLGTDIDDHIETSALLAFGKEELRSTSMLPEKMSIGFDGVEFSVNNDLVGSIADIIKMLVEKEHVHPVAAENFVKQAMERKKVLVHLSKKADFEPGTIPQFGDNPPDQNNPWGTENLGKGAVAKAKAVAPLQDPSVMEATIISELLNNQDLIGSVQEYLPDILEAIDRLGRLLFLLRFNSAKPQSKVSTESITESVNSVRNTYRMLGDNYLKLRTLT